MSGIPKQQFCAVFEVELGFKKIDVSQVILYSAKRTPLTVLSSHIELLLMKQDRDDLPKRLDTMKNQVQYCTELSRSTMNYLRQDTSNDGQCLNSIVNLCLQVARPLLRENNVKLETHLDTELPPTPCDVVTMRQAAMNIITNACQAMKAHGGKDRNLCISTWVEDGNACLSFEDSGPGIPDHMRDTIFETFFSTKGESGTGLGLGVVQTVVLRTNGSVAVEDGKYGTGANFVLRIPLNQ